MRVLVACEFSGRVRDAFVRHGHDAWSCDIIDTELPGNHIVGDVLGVLDRGWDLLIAFPPCTFLTKAGNCHWHLPRFKQGVGPALEFVLALMNAPVERIAIENPVGRISTLIRKPDQIINPYQFGEEFKKATCLWLKNLPKLKPTNIVPKGTSFCNQFSGKKRSQNRSRTFVGVAEAMAEQWGRVETLSGFGLTVQVRRRP